MTREQLLIIKDDADRHWFAKDGTMCLEWHGIPPETAPNDNGALFAVLFYWFCHKLGILDEADKFRFRNMEIRLRSSKSPGLHHRNPGRKTRDEAHDNPRALISGAVLFDLPNIIYNINTYGIQNGYVFENVDMESDDLDPHLIERKKSWWYKILGFDITRWRQGSNVAFYKLAMAWMPTPWNLIWMLGGYLITAFKKVKDESGVVRFSTDEHFLNWIEFLAIEIKYEQMKNSKIRWLSFFKFIFLVRDFWKMMLARKTDKRGMEAIVKGYFDPPDDRQHPIEKLTIGIFY